MTERYSRTDTEVASRQVVRSSPLPAWAQVAQHFKRAIDQGTVASGQQLPSETNLALEFGVSRITIRQALGHLSSEGYVDRRQGIGTFVAPRRLPIQHDLSLDNSWRERLMEQGYKPVSRVIEVGLPDGVPSEVAARLPDLTPSLLSSPLAYFKRLQCVDDEPIGMSESWVPLSIAPEVHKEPLIDGSLSSTLHERYGLRPAVVDNVVEAVLATATEAHVLQTFVDVPLFALTSLSRHRNGAVVHVSRTAWVAGRVRFHYLHRSAYRPYKP
jgi:GntR family transcriptional regulator